MPDPASVLFRERLFPPPLWWITAALLSGMTAAMVFPVSKIAALIAPLVVFALVCWAIVTLSVPVAVTAGEFIAGPAHIERQFIAGATPLDAKQAFVARGADLDARAYLVTRPWVKELVKVDLNDPADPTPYWLVSTYQPHKLAAALNNGRVD